MRRGSSPPQNTADLPTKRFSRGSSVVERGPEKAGVGGPIPLLGILNKKAVVLVNTQRLLYFRVIP